MKINVKHACSFTGHRPERMNEPEERVIEWLKGQIKKAVEDGYTDFISGMQRGVKEAGIDVRLLAASAFMGMEREWDVKWQERYDRIMAKADEVVFIGNTPGRVAFYRRNEWMIDHSSRLIAVYTGAPGGTKETISYAEKKGLSIVRYKKENDT